MLLPIVGLVLVLIIYVVYKAMPTPIPGIPHNHDADKKILGDVSKFMASAKETGETFNWFAAQTTRLNSPIVQVFVRPFYKPWVIITDFQESQDILLRRASEFDRSKFSAEMLDGILPNHHIHKLMSDRAFTSNRHLIKDLMTPSFLHKVAAPQIYSSATHLVDLWNLKMDRAKGHAFSAPSDLFHCAFDVIFWVTFGQRTKLSAIQAQIQFQQQSSPTISEEHDTAVFGTAPLPKEFEAIVTLSDTIEEAVKSPMPRQTHWLLRQLPSIRRAIKVKEQMLDEEINFATQSFTPSTERERTSAMTDMLWREYSAALKEGRQPDYNQPALRDELFGFLIAGIDTTSSTMAWALKFLADNSRVQTTLRGQLRQTFQEAAHEDRMPTYDEIIKSQLPYLDAVIEEVIRLMPMTGGIIRQAIVDTEILGHQIPKGTEVFLMCNGPSFWTPAMQIPANRRQDSALNAKSRVPEWDPADVDQFKPERWLTPRGFNPLAGPVMGFGLGPRGCYGRRLAYLELRILLITILWNFSLEQCPPELSSYRNVEKLVGQPQQCYVRLARAPKN